jgi:DNA invertase Pin-like site-specific DNA recombinase
MTAAKYVLYYRVSTEEQGKSGLGLEAQHRDISLYLETYSPTPWDIVGEFTDIESGANSSRPELAKAIELARKTKATLLVSKLDRLSRKVSFIATLMEDKRLTFRVASMPHADAFQLHIYAALAEQERAFISLRTKAALQEAKARGVKLGGLRDTTMKRNAVRMEQAQAQAEAWRGVVEPMHHAGKSLREIAAALNAAGIKTSRGGEWQAKTVSRVIERLTTGSIQDAA